MILVLNDKDTIDKVSQLLIDNNFSLTSSRIKAFEQTTLIVKPKLEITMDNVQKNITEFFVGEFA